MEGVTKAAADLVGALAKAGAFDRETAKTITSPAAAARLVNQGYLAKASRKPKGGSQTTIYWLTADGRALHNRLKGR